MLNHLEKSDLVERTRVKIEFVDETSFEFEVGSLVVARGEAHGGIISIDANNTYSLDSSQTIGQNTGAAADVENKIPGLGIDPPVRLLELKLMPESLRGRARRYRSILVVAADRNSVASAPNRDWLLLGKSTVCHRDCSWRISWGSESSIGRLR
jgi:hypothetical protein